jgi:hypothetical protein
MYDMSALWKAPLVKGFTKWREKKAAGAFARGLS